MKIALCISKDDEAFYLQQPVECLYTARILQDSGHEVVVLDGRTRSWQELDVAKHEPDLAIVVTAVYDRTQNYPLMLHGSAELVSHLRSVLPDVPVVVSGVHGSIEPQTTARTLRPDVTLPGELEVAIPWLVERFESDRSVINDPFPDPKVVPQKVDPALLPVPSYELADLDAYHGEVVERHSRSLRDGRTGLIFANRGCPYQCSFCFVWFGSQLRYRPVGKVIEELHRQVELGIHDFFFLDYTFTMDHAWVTELCRAIVGAGLDITWLCQTRCDRVTPQLLADMRSAGCTGIWYGVEAPWVADAGMKKPLTRTKIEDAIRATDGLGILNFLYILLGVEGREARMDAELQYWLTDVPAIFTLNPILPRPHTGVWRRHHGPSNTPSWDDLGNTSIQFGHEHYWSPGLRQLYERLSVLPNYILNAGETGFVVK